MGGIDRPVGNENDDGRGDYTNFVDNNINEFNVNSTNTINKFFENI